MRHHRRRHHRRKYEPRVYELKSFFALDYSQIEIRMLAEITGDKLLIKQFRSGKDIHCAVGHELTGWSEARIAEDKKTRRLVKNMHFAIVYGVSRDGLYDYIIAKIREQDGEKADLTGITRKGLAKLYDAYFERYAGVARFIREIRKQVQAGKGVETLFGFRRDIQEKEEGRGTYWLNQAVNTPIQGTAHQLILMAMGLLHIKPRTYNMLQDPVMEVHDALDFFCPVEDLPKAYQQGKKLLETDVVVYAKKHFGYEIKVPLIAEAEAGFCIGSMVDYKGESPDEFLEMWRAKHKKVEAESWENFRIAA